MIQNYSEVDLHHLFSLFLPGDIHYIHANDSAIKNQYAIIGEKFTIFICYVRLSVTYYWLIALLFIVYNLPFNPVIALGQLLLVQDGKLYGRDPVFAVICKGAALPEAAKNHDIQKNEFISQLGQVKFCLTFFFNSFVS